MLFVRSKQLGGFEQNYRYVIAFVLQSKRFLGLTPAEVYKQEEGEVIDAIKNFVDAKRAGGFA